MFLRYSKSPSRALLDLVNDIKHIGIIACVNWDLWQLDKLFFQ